MPDQDSPTGGEEEICHSRRQTEVGPQDRRDTQMTHFENELTIETDNPLDLSFWALILEVSEADVREAVQAVGGHAAEVAQYFTRRSLADGGFQNSRSG